MSKLTDKLRDYNTKLSYDDRDEIAERLEFLEKYNRAEREVIDAAITLNDNVREESWPRNGDEPVIEPRGANSSAVITVKARKMIKLRKALQQLQDKSQVAQGNNNGDN